MIDEKAVEAVRAAITEWLRHRSIYDAGIMQFHGDEIANAAIEAYLRALPASGGEAAYADLLQRQTDTDPDIAAIVGQNRTKLYMDAAPAFSLQQGEVEPGWRPIETAPKDKSAVLIAVPTKDRDGFHVGEAYFDPENYDDGDWWWAGTGWGDYHAGPISEINHHAPTHWQPLPAAPQHGSEP